MVEVERQGAEGTPLERQLRDMNEALLVSSIRQHELAEQAHAAETALRQSEAVAVEARQATETLNGELRESERRIREVVDLLPAAVYTTDAEGRVTHFNSAVVALLGRMPKIGEDQCVSWKMFYPDGTPLPHEECPMATALKEGRPIYGKEAIVERPDGTRVWVAPYPTPIKDREGNVVGAINMVMDITKRALLENESKEHVNALAAMDRRKDEFLATLSHELRNPLACILNAVQLLRFDQARTPIQLQAQGMLDRQVGQLTRLVDDLLEVSRISTGRIRLQAERVALGGVVLRAMDSLREPALNKEQTVEISLPDEPVWVQGDSVRLEQVVVNIINNASKYTHRSGNIWVKVSVEGDEAFLRVRDNGIGIAPDMLPKIFDLFAQAETSLERSQGGLGIGLALVKSLVAMHRGRVEVQSTPGKGSEFTVRLPALSSPQVSPSRPADSAPVPDRALRVLVVDDNLDAANSAAMLLRAAGHEVRTAYNAMTAMQTARECLPEVVFLDIGLPVVSGLRLAEQIRAVPALRDAILIAVTGYGQESDRQRSREAGFNHHLVKPVNFANIESILSAASRTQSTGAPRASIEPLTHR